MGGSSAVFGAAPASNGSLEVLKMGNQHGILIRYVCISLCIYIITCNMYKIV